MKTRRNERIKTLNRARAMKTRRGGFTVLEMIVALAIMVLLMVIIFVPLTQAFNSFSIGRSRAQVQQAAQRTMIQIERELRAAIHVYPNDNLPGVTDKAPYADSSGQSQGPYFREDACSGARVGNTSRIDLLLPMVDENGNIVNPLRPANYVVTYYARRLSLDPNAPYDPIDNPVGLYRAQMPYRDANGQDLKSNVDASNGRYGAGCTADGSLWLTQSADGEPTLDVPGTFEAEGTFGDHTLASPRGMGLIAPNALATTPNYSPETSFICEDTNDDGKVDRVTINLVLGQFDAKGAGTQDGQPAAQQVRLSQTVELPNVK